MKLFRMILIGMVVCGAFGAKLGAYLNVVGLTLQSSWSSIEMGFSVGALIGIVGALIISIATSQVWNEESQRETQPVSHYLATHRAR
ncbi:MAG: hypothetical protein AAF600_14235 [Bacteroidota bacterium]